MQDDYDEEPKLLSGQKCMIFCKEGGMRSRVGIKSSLYTTCMFAGYTKEWKTWETCYNRPKHFKYKEAEEEIKEMKKSSQETVWKKDQPSWCSWCCMNMRKMMKRVVNKLEGRTKIHRECRSFFSSSTEGCCFVSPSLSFFYPPQQKLMERERERERASERNRLFPKP